MPTTPHSVPEGARRELKSRQQPWAQKAARAVDQMGLSPNMISVLSIFFALQACACFIATAWAQSPLHFTVLMIGAILGIQLRLLCNLLDGMVAIEGGKKSAVGGLYNEIPDRIADPLILACAGYLGGTLLEWHHIPVGWVAAALSLFTAYIRVLGGSLGLAQSFMGPMAKQHRMALLTLASLILAVAAWFSDPLLKLPAEIMRYTLLLMVIGSIVTCIRRSFDLSYKLRHPNA